MTHETFYSLLILTHTHTYTASITIMSPVFYFGGNPVHTFADHKNAFARQYNNSDPHNFTDRKFIDLHEDIIKQMYVKFNEHDVTITMLKIKCAELEHQVKQAKKQNDEMKAYIENLQEDLFQKEKKERYMELVKELREIENDLKFYKKVDG